MENNNGKTPNNKSLDNIVANLGRSSVLMAYSLNNHQPVQCTMISDQPFFYMDEEVCDEDDAILSDDAFMDLDLIEPEVLENELVQMKTKIDAYERISLDFVKDRDERHQQFLMDSNFIAKGIPDMPADELLKKIKDTLQDSLYARELLSYAQKNGITLEISNQIETAAYDKKAGKIFIRGDIELSDQVLLAVQELRRHWQHNHGALVHPLTFHPDQAVLINRAQLADLAVATVRVAWDLKIAGHHDIWLRIENSSMGDLGRAHAREALADFRTLNNGKAGAAVFETWFLSERCRNQDKKLIQAMLADYRGYVFESAEASHMISIDLICALGEQPAINGVKGKNYLATYALMILNDSLFTDVRDRSNANFLWFIKFEREFTETEQQLQSSSIITKPGASDQADNIKFEDTNHENAFSAAEKEQLRQSIFSTPENNAQGKGGDNVIHIQFGTNKHCEGISS
jgi:hypothetical protein